mgnify:CR=1 FL=1
MAKRLDSEQFEVHIACKTDEGVFFKTISESGIPIHVFNYEAPMRPVGKMLKAAWKISRKLKEINPDIIHSFHYNNMYGEALAAKFAGIKWIFTKKNMNWGSDGANAWKLRSYFANHIVIQNSEMKRKFYPNSDKTTLIERGIEIQNFVSKEPKEGLRKAMNTPESARIIITVANLAPVKGVNFLIEAFLKLEKDFQDWHLWIVGDDQTETGNQLKQLVAEADLADRIHFLGKQEDVCAYLTEAEIFVLPTKSTGEGSPVALLEAMANSKVVLGSDVPGISDQLRHVPKHLFEAENVESLARTLERTMKNGIKTNHVLGKFFFKHVSEYYSISKEVFAHERLYKSLVS